MSLLETIAQVTAETNSSFSGEIPNLQIGIDSTSLGNFKTCPRLYYYRHILGYSRRSGAGVEENPHIKFGSIYHEASEIYDHCRASGGEHEDGLHDALRFAIDRTWDYDRKEPWQSTEPTKSRKTLLRTLVWYYEHFKDDPLKTLILRDGRPAVELSFRFALAELGDDDFVAPSGEPYILCGHLDRVVTWNDELWIVDKKTTKSQLNDSYFAHYNPDNQMSLYTLAGQVVLHSDVEGVIIDAVQVMVNGSRFQRKPIARTQGQLEEWLSDLKFFLRMMEAYARLGYWPQNDKACNTYGGCEFIPICSADPLVRDDLLEAFYTKRVWDPLQPR